MGVMDETDAIGATSVMDAMGVMISMGGIAGVAVVGVKGVRIAMPGIVMNTPSLREVMNKTEVTDEIDEKDKKERMRGTCAADLGIPGLPIAEAVIKIRAGAAYKLGTMQNSPALRLVEMMVLLAATVDLHVGKGIAKNGTMVTIETGGDLVLTMAVVVNVEGAIPGLNDTTVKNRVSKRGAMRMTGVVTRSAVGPGQMMKRRTARMRSRRRMEMLLENVVTLNLWKRAARRRAI